MQTDRADTPRDTAGYQIDPNAVADAILSRLLAGRTLAPPGADERR